MRFLAILLFTVFITLPAFGSENIQSKGKFGIGLQVGYPHEGLSANYFLSNTVSIQVNPVIRIKKGWFGFGSRVDLLSWMGNIAKLNFADFVWFGGFGGNFFWVTTDNDNYFAVGAEGVIGAGFQFKKAPIDFNFELVPVLQILGSEGIDLWFGIAGVLNARYYF